MRRCRGDPDVRSPRRSWALFGYHRDVDWDAWFAARSTPCLLAVLLVACDAGAVPSRADTSSGTTGADPLFSSSTTVPSTSTDGTSEVESTTGGGQSPTEPGTATGSMTTHGTTSEGSTGTGDETTTGRETRGGGTSGSSTESSSSTSAVTSTTSETTTSETTAGGTSTGGTSTGGTTAGETSTGEVPTGTTGEDDDPCTFSEDFEGYADGSPWPPGWTSSGGVELADIEGGWARLRPLLTDYSLGRMVRALPCVEPDVSLTFMFTAAEAQGIGLYTRHNGSYLLEGVPPGRGYSAFAESFRDPHGIGVWREVGGTEQQLAHQPATVEADVEYRMRYRVTQQDPYTALLQAKLWPVGEPEPADWMVESTDDALSLQAVSGRMTVDAWVSEEFNGPVAPDLLIDDIVVAPAL